MSLNDPFFTKFDGSPDLGRVPVRLVVNGSGRLSQGQFREVEHAYHQFRSACRVSASNFHTERLQLSDGSWVWLWSLQGNDEVTVWPSEDGDGQKLAHGFVVATNWQTPLFYCRDLNDGVHWLIGGDPVEQVDSHTSTIFDNQVFRKAGDAWFNLPHVFDNGKRSIWDYAVDGGLVSGGTQVTPFLVKNDATGELAFEPAHYIDQNKIVDVSATALYTMADAASILAPSSPFYPDTVKYLPGATDADGNRVELQAMRYACLSATANIWKFRLWNEIIRRTGDATYELVERNAIDYITPWGKQTITLADVSDSSSGEDPTQQMKFRWTCKVQYGSAGRPSGAPPGNYHWNTGWSGTQDWVDISGVNNFVNYDSTMRRIKTQASGDAETDLKPVAAPIHNEISHIQIERSLNYPAQVYWRGAITEKEFTTNDLLIFFNVIYGYSPFLSPRWYTYGCKLNRIDTNYDVDGSPSVVAKLGWKDLTLLSGTTTGRMSGKVYSDDRKRFGQWDTAVVYSDFVTKEVPYPIPGTWSWLVANDDRAEMVADFLEFGTLPGGGSNPTNYTEVLFDIRPTNTVNYALTSRYVIDYDHKGRFYAAIRCEVTCSGAEWEENRAVYDGFMQVKTDPIYVVKIWFESHWNGVDAQQLLAEETVARPCFEAITVEMFSPWYWRGYAFIDRNCKARTPPEPVPDENFMMMFQNLASHQGVNTNLCCADVRPDITGDDIALTKSQDGIEYSYMLDGAVIPHTRYVTGQLYARTFKLSDFYEAFWMLRQLKVNATEDNIEGTEEYPRPEWFYHPIIKAALDVQRHIEVRDGVIVQWSDNIPGETSGYPPTPAAPPAATARSINLYRV